MAGKSIRDGQRQKVYDSEALVFEGRTGRRAAFQKPPEYKTVAECQQFVDHVTASDTWTKVLGVHTASPLAVLDGRGRRRGGANSFHDEITLPRFARRRWYLLHELAHIATDYKHNLEPDGTDSWWWEPTAAAHGPEYAGIYLLLVRAFLGQEAHDALLSKFENNRVKVHHIEVEPSVFVGTNTDTPPDVTDDATPRCAECGMVLSTAGTHHTFCSDRCRWTFHNRRRRQRTAGTREKVCEVCGKEFTAKRNDAKTCSAACKQEAYRQRVRA